MENVNFTIPKFKVHKIATNKDELIEFKASIPEEINWAESLYGIPQMWHETMGEGIKVAVLDTGVDLNHPDLRDAIIDYRDFTGEGIDDGNGHGTHCAGVIGARLNDIGFVGIAPKCELLIAKVLKNDKSGTDLTVAQGIDWAVEKGANIISMSVGGFSSSDELFYSIHNALLQRRGVICAAGNQGGLLYQNTISYPGKYGGVITVASHDINGNVSGFSSKGGEIDVMAPGSEIWSTYKNGSYAQLSGTSMATPFVAGLSALILSKHLKIGLNKTPINNNEDLREHLIRISTHPGYHDNASGYGPLLAFQNFKNLNYFY